MNSDRRFQAVALAGRSPAPGVSPASMGSMVGGGAPAPAMSPMSAGAVGGPGMGWYGQPAVGMPMQGYPYAASPQGMRMPHVPMPVMAMPMVAPTSPASGGVQMMPMGGLMQHGYAPSEPGFSPHYRNNTTDPSA
ncbi:hypothetical protein EON62_05005 [archaeon]|nr:MAG: hypothetical protein EON62_05005 [archaeon]